MYLLMRRPALKFLILIIDVWVSLRTPELILRYSKIKNYVYTSSDFNICDT